jgi:hypothetical protein
MLAAIKTEKPMSEISTPDPAAAGPRVRPVPAVTRSIAILRLLGRGGEPMTLKAISQELGMVTTACTFFASWWKKAWSRSIPAPSATAWAWAC